ncbi:MAG: hypothetical protein WCK47_14760, partial [bacterium]
KAILITPSPKDAKNNSQPCGYSTRSEKIRFNNVANYCQLSGIFVPFNTAYLMKHCLVSHLKSIVTRQGLEP